MSITAFIALAIVALIGVPLCVAGTIVYFTPREKNFEHDARALRMES